MSMTPLDYERGIERLKQELNAVILAHYYQESEIQDLADFVGDSLALAQQAAKTTAEVIVFCGVHFMAETAKILNPGKLVLLPDLKAGCSLSDRCPPQAFQAFRKKHPEAYVVTYVNSSAEVKAESDVCCTSANAIEVVNSLDEDQIIFVPDKHLGRWVSEHTDKKIVSHQGFCPTHARLMVEDVLKAKEAHPDALFVAHPECRYDVLLLADHVTSTAGMFKFAAKSDAKEFIIGTEIGMLYMLHRNNPGKRF